MQSRARSGVITTDYCYTENALRPFLAKTPTLTSLGIDNFDNVERLGDLQPTIKEANQSMAKKLQTKSIEKIRQVLKLGLTREITSIQNRK